jgi:hypothetical protein
MDSNDINKRMWPFSKKIIPPIEEKIELSFEIVREDQRRRLLVLRNIQSNMPLEKAVIVAANRVRGSNLRDWTVLYHSEDHWDFCCFEPVGLNFEGYKTVFSMGGKSYSTAMKKFRGFE